MKKITELAELKAAIRRHFRGGMTSNFTLSDSEILREIGSGALFTEESEDCLFILRDRGSHVILEYYVNSLPLPPLPDCTAVCEITARGRDGIRGDIASALEEEGFTREFERVRLVRPSGETEPKSVEGFDFAVAGEDDLAEVFSLYASSFDCLTGSLSTEAELSERIASGGVFAAKKNGAIAGALETTAEKGFTEIRHLAVSAEHRGRGLGAALVRHYLNATGGRKSFVWTEPSRPAALKTYMNCGYTEDGNVSLVMTKGRKT